MADQSKQYKNEHLEISVTHNPGCELVCEVKVSPKAVASAYQEGLKKVSRQVSLPGFRKGKAPKKLLEQQFATHIDQEWKDVVVQVSFREMLDLTNLMPLSNKSIKAPKLESCSKEEGAHVIYTYEAEPVVPDVDPKDIEIKKVEAEKIDDEKIEDALTQLRLHHAEWEKAEREAKAGDFVDLNIDNIDTEPPTQLCKDRRFELKKGKSGQWLINLLEGMKAGESKEAASEVDEDASEDVKKRFQSTRCKVELVAVQEPSLPELDDEFSKKLGVDTLAVLKEKVQEQLESEAKMKAKKELKNQVQEALIKNYIFEVPASLLEDERRLRIKERIRLLMAEGQSEEEIKAQEEAIEKEVDEETKASLRLFFLVKSFSSKEKITVSNDETAQALMQEMYRFPIAKDQGKQPDVPPEVFARVYSNLLIDKVEDFLVDKVKMA